ncbi:MAG TPA: malate dehydrogenase [Actinomycetota bacterium]|nr:malate dehydrogenase [Actinomycetota bacterium]
MAKITVVGAGFVGRTTAVRIAESNLADVCLLDVIEGWPQGLAMDIRHSAPIQGIRASVVGTNDYADSAGSDIVVITAGMPRGPGMSRMDLLEKNAGIVGSVCDQVKQTSPDAVVIVVTNPLDEMTFLAAERTGFPRARVMGMAGILDSARLAVNIAEELGVSPLGVKAMTLGSHGEQMVPLPRQATVDGRPLEDLVDAPTLQKLFNRTRAGGAEIVGLLQKGSAFYAPSAASAQMCRAILSGSGEVLPVCAWVTGEYGIPDVYLGVPARLGRGGVEEIVELELNPDELAQLTQAADAIRGRCADLAKIGSTAGG